MSVDATTTLERVANEEEAALKEADLAVAALQRAQERREHTRNAIEKGMNHVQLVP
tara:strand:- start:1155 stop:1322 length:168 start_codon:yes stop_codon:yes gene_type:complete